MLTPIVTDGGNIVYKQLSWRFTDLFLYTVNLVEL